MGLGAGMGVGAAVGVGVTMGVFVHVLVREMQTERYIKKGKRICIHYL